jgi:hypothetical protein
MQFGDGGTVRGPEPADLDRRPVREQAALVVVLRVGRHVAI